jgi:F-type H+-transporting ATPase subunit gamma
MPSLKDFRVRIGSVKNTRKITSAMKMVAASKLRQAQARAEAGRPYALKMSEALARLILAIGQRDEKMPLLDGTGQNRRVLFVAMAADRGLCGGFNGNLVRELRRQISRNLVENREVKVVTVGRKTRDLLKREYPELIVESLPLITKYETAEKVTTRVIDMFTDGQFDKAYVVYSAFKNVMTQTPTVKQIIPFEISEKVLHDVEGHGNADEPRGIYTFEPSAQILLERLVPQQIAAQVYSLLLEVAAGEQAARMAAMDNATRNAGDMINRLTLSYNRARQAYITKEVSEIVAGAEASA